MPYIKPTLRPFLIEVMNLIYKSLEQEEFPNNIYHCALSIFQNWLHIQREQGKSIDGFLNYMTTIMLLTSKTRSDTHWKVTRYFIRDILLTAYRSPENYTNYQNGKGFIYSVLDEFDRRGWTTKKIRKEILDILKWWNKLMANYENEKIIENGDL